MSIIKGNQIFATDFTLQVPVGGLACAFYLNNAGREFKLKSVTFDVKLTDTAGNYLPWERNTTQDVELKIGVDGAIPLFAKCFEDHAPAPLFLRNGNLVTLYRPKQIFFENWFIANSIKFNYACVNNDLAAYYHKVSVQAEIEIL